MRLGSLKKLDEIDTKKEIKILNQELKFLTKLIKNKKFLDIFLIEEIKKTNKDLKDFKYQRKTVISIRNKSLDDSIVEEFQQIEKLTVIINNDGSIKSYKDHLDLEKLKINKKNFMDAYTIMSNQKLLLLVSSGRVFTINPNDLPSGKANPKNFIYFIDSNMDDKLVKLLPYNDNLSCFVASKNGKGFIADMSNIQTSQKKGKQLFNLKSNDQLIKVIEANSSHLACINTEEKLLIFKLTDLPTLQKGFGVQLQKMKNNIFLSDVQLFNIKDGISWKSGTLNRNEKKIDSWLGKRSQSGKKIPKKFNKSLIFYD